MSVWSSRGRLTVSRINFRGFSDELGFWNTNCALRRLPREVEVQRPVRRLVEVDEQSAERRLPAPGLADEPEGLALPDPEVDAVDGFHVPDVSFKCAARDGVVPLDPVTLDDDVLRPAERVGPKADPSPLVRRAHGSTSVVGSSVVP